MHVSTHLLPALLVRVAAQRARSALGRVHHAVKAALHLIYPAEVAGPQRRNLLVLQPGAGAHRHSVTWESATCIVEQAVPQQCKIHSLVALKAMFCATAQLRAMHKKHCICSTGPTSSWQLTGSATRSEARAGALSRPPHHPGRLQTRCARTAATTRACTITACSSRAPIYMVRLQFTLQEEL